MNRLTLTLVHFIRHSASFPYYVGALAKYQLGVHEGKPPANH